MVRSRLSFVRVLATLFAMAMLLATSRGHAFCREVTQSPPIGYDPTQSGCFGANPDGGAPLPPLFWKNQCVGYSLQRSASKQVSLAEAQAAASNAFNAWSSITCPGGGLPGISAVQLPPVDCDFVPSQLHNNVIIFRDDGWPYEDNANAIGLTSLRVCTAPGPDGCPGDPDALPGEILGADTEINSSDYTIVTTGTPDGGANAYDLASILTHEAGHFLGLAHTTDTSAVMYAFYHPGSTVPQPDDVAGICEIYPPGGTRYAQYVSVAATLCDPSPLLGLEDDCGSIDAGAPGFDDAGDAGDPAPTTNSDTLFGCAIGHRSPAGGGGLGACALVALVALARAKGGSRRRRFAAGAIGLLAGMGGLAAIPRDANASVSVVVAFDDLIERATAVAVVTPLEQHALWEGRHIVTYTRAHVDRQIAGRLAPDVWIRALGGDVGKVGERIEGQATFALGSPSLVFLHPHLDPVTKSPSGTFGVVEGAQGQFSIVPGEGGRERLAVSPNVGGLVPPATANAPRPAQDVLRDRPLDDAASEIAAAWSHRH